LPRPQSALPPDFFDNKEAKRQKTGTIVHFFLFLVHLNSLGKKNK
jgi:hypothetical protein